MANEKRTTQWLAAEHERLSDAVTPLVIAYAHALDSAPVCSQATPIELEALFDEPLPLSGTTTTEILAKVERDVIPHAMNIPSPRYYGLFNPTPLPVAVWADTLASTINQNGAAWRNSPSASIIEARVLRWLCELIGYPSGAFGTLTSGGSEANLIGLKCARDAMAEESRDRGLRASDAKGNLVVYASDQCHYSFVKCVDILGIGRDNLRKVKTDERFHIRIDELRRAIERDIEEGHTPCAIAGAAGATSTGIVDPLDELARVAKEFGVWYHVDAAYGGGLALSEKHRRRLRGIEHADSVTIDPHKWMFVPFACGAVLLKDGGSVLRDAFDITPEYMSEARGGDDAQYDFFRYGQLGSRRFNALKIWMALKNLGVRGYAEIIEHQIELAEYLATRLSELPNFEVAGEVETALCCARFVPATSPRFEPHEIDEMQRTLQQRCEKSGEAWFATTVVHGRRVLRFNVNSFLTEQRHVDDLIELLRRESGSLMREAGIQTS